MVPSHRPHFLRISLTELLTDSGPFTTGICYLSNEPRVQRNRCSHVPVQKRQHAFGPAAARPPESCQAQLQGSPERGTEDHPAQQGRDCRQPARCRLQCPRIASLRLRLSVRVLEALTISRGAETPQGFPVVAGDSTVWARHLTGGDIAVALYNEDDAPKSIGAPFAALGWTATTKPLSKTCGEITQRPRQRSPRPQRGRSATSPCGRTRL